MQKIKTIGMLEGMNEGLLWHVYNAFCQYYYNKKNKHKLVLTTHIKCKSLTEVKQEQKEKKFENCLPYCLCWGQKLFTKTCNTITIIGIWWRNKKLKETKKKTTTTTARQRH